MTTRQWVYRFDELDSAERYVGGSWEDVRALFGGKGANLAEMVRIGVPVPPGFIVTTEACNVYLEAGGIFPEGMWDQVLQALHTIEADTGKTFGDPRQPLLVSCRSGAKFSMPGMMDTVLNIGLNDLTAQAMVNLTGDERFVFDAYRRLIQMFGSVVMGVADEVFEHVLTAARQKAGVTVESDLQAADWKEVTDRFKNVFRNHTQIDFPQDPLEQLRMATEAVFKSWNGKRAVDYRNAANIPHDLGTAVNIVTMVFGNMGNDCATGVAMTRNGSTGEPGLEGDFLINAQGEDVVAGIRMTEDITTMAASFPEAYEELCSIANKLELHYRDMQDMEFTIEKGKLWMLQTRDGKRTARAAVRIAVDMTREGLISMDQAVLRISPEQIDFFLHPQFDPAAIADARSHGRMVARGLNVSPGAAGGLVVFEADLAETWTKRDGKKVILVRPETKPDDVHGLLAAQGVLTSRGGRTSHAALVARQFGKPAVVGVAALEIDLSKREMRCGETLIREGDVISIDGNTGEVFLGELPTMLPDIKDPWLIDLLSWADEYRTLGVWANADYPEDARRARSYGAQGIGLCRSEHMFFETDRLPLFQKMIMARLPVDQREALDALLPFQRDDFAGLFREMDGMPVIIRLIDPPLHEFLPDLVELMGQLSDLKLRIRDAGTLPDIDALLEEIRIKERLREQAEKLKEQNPMLGMRGVRLGIHIPDLTKMQVRAIFEAACLVTREGVTVLPKIMIPLVGHANELKVQREALEAEAQAVMAEQNLKIDYKFGTMIELPRAALTADQIAEYAEFFSYGTNDLTQTTYGISRDDAESGFLIEYVGKGILPENPFATLDEDGVVQLMKIGVDKGRSVRPDLECGICGEHGGDPRSIALCHSLGLTYVSCSPFRVPIARLAAAHAALRKK
ncbi:pyruvate, phosphate dikinase [Desulfofustis limnaeus]|jgi:pyruvate,orthophosphate dikinase|uniref:Pyruvate, phosphate dikinase n=1 Tax=Desulfofustis limnaeus TaxID=2740163 RepID=A0ABM7W9P1_9BACT|nr:pyruvate, phosphate dikinase [Desulfofustis limnaeus]MDX9894658.1 pyruvate, phosphate dikinase [Desulfofustis sp.]BDD87712.1 pyruvate, phosphate dikinase [Desulfofustis limnaeus]